ncbi:signal transduction histidine kinase [Stappia sp. 22II-S9-Z10]|nr:signal transduction histidine kinase [Stappia sp. 22II-S9-Z10]
MIRSRIRNAWRKGPSRLGAGLAAGCLGVALVAALSLFAVEIVAELKSLQATSRDNVQWTLAQFEVEYYTLLNALRTASPEDEESLAELRQRFDIFYSRAATLSHGAVFEPLIADDEMRNRLSGIRDALDRSIPAIDGNDAELGASLPLMLDRFDAVRPDLRAISLRGIRQFAVASDARRVEFSTLLVRTALIAATLIVLLMVSLAALVRLNRVANRRADEVRLSAERFQTTINSSPNAIVITDADGRIIDFNPAAAEIFGYSRAVAIGAKVEDLIVPAERRAQHRNSLHRYKETGVGRLVGRGRVQLDAQRANGTVFPIEMALAAATAPQGQIFLAYVRDITERLETEMELTAARDKALAAAKARAQFLAVMSHEMRTPLNGVLAILDLLGATALSPLQRRYVDTATRSGEILQHHIDDVLDVTRIESGRLSFKPQPFSLVGLLEEMERINLPLAEARHNTLRRDVRLPDTAVVGDSHRIGQVLLNLVGNAVKFTEGGVITIGARLEDTRRNVLDGRLHTVVLTVRDTGIGIASDDLERIFEDFVTLDPSYKRTVSGYGLGLSICRRIVEAMGGAITVKSDPGYGSAFTVRLPLAFTAEAPDVGAAVPGPAARARRPVPPAAQEADAPDGEPHRQAPGTAPSVLLVEDNETNRFAARQMLQQAGCRVTEAADGFIGVVRADRERFDLILMDLRMPHVDGLEATRRIRAGSGRSADVPIIGLTAQAMPEEQAEARRAGMEDCLLKPLRFKNLTGLLERLPAFAGLGEGGTPSAPAATPRPAGAAAASCEDDAQGDARDDGDVVDRAVLDELLSIIPPAAFAAQVDAFRIELDETLTALRTEAEAGDLPALGRTAHKTCGSAAIFGLVGLQDILATLEESCVEGEAEFALPLIGAFQEATGPALQALDCAVERISERAAAASA